MRVVEIPADLNDLRKRDDLRTGELFRFCLGQEFRIEGFDRHGFPELYVSENRRVAQRFGRWHWIWVDPRFLALVKPRPGRVRRRKGLGWKIDFEKSEFEWRKQQRSSARRTEC